MPFHILSLSGGGYRGLFTIDILAKLENKYGRPIGECFDLIAGTSIGGIIAIGLTMGRTAAEIRDVFIEHGEVIFPTIAPPRTKIGAFWQILKGGAKRNPDPLRNTIETIIGQGKKIRDAKTYLIVPSIDMTKGSVRMFKTPHTENLFFDKDLFAVDVAMATSAAPTIFPMAKINASSFVDGGLVANSPDACALHEAQHFLGQTLDDINILSIGTTKNGYALPSGLGTNLGIKEWMTNFRLINTVFGAQEQMVDYMIGHALGSRYKRINMSQSSEQIGELGLDVATEAARQTLLGLADAAFQECAQHPSVRAALTHKPLTPVFY